MQGMRPLCQEPEACGQGPASEPAGWQGDRRLCPHTHGRVIHRQQKRFFSRSGGARPAGMRWAALGAATCLVPPCF